MTTPVMTPLPDFVTSADPQDLKAYSLFIQGWEGDREWSVGFRIRPTFGVEAKGPTPTVEEVAKALISAPSALPALLIPIIQAAHAEATKA